MHTTEKTLMAEFGLCRAAIIDLAWKKAQKYTDLAKIQATANDDFDASDNFVIGYMLYIY